MQVTGKIIVPSETFFGWPIQSLPSQDPNQVEKYYLQFLSGDGRGYLADIASIENGEIHCENDLPSFVQPGDSFLISRHHRLSEIFTPDNTYGFGSGESADQSDQIAVFNPDTQDVEIFYYHSGRSRWEKGGIPENANDHLLRYPYSYYVIRRTPGMIKIVLKGSIQETPILLPVQTGLNLFSLPVGNSGSLSKLVTVAGLHSAQSGSNAATSDLFVIHEASSAEQRGPFYYRSDANATEWQKVGESDSNETSTLPDPLSSLVVHRKGAPGYLRVESDSYNPPPYFSLEANAQPGEIATFTLLQFPPQPSFSPGPRILTLEASNDQLNWNVIDNGIFSEDGSILYPVPVPPGQSRRFYRIISNSF